MAILGKAIYYGPMGVSMLLVPKVASAWTLRRSPSWASTTWPGTQAASSGPLPVAFW